MRELRLRYVAAYAFVHGVIGEMPPRDNRVFSLKAGGRYVVRTSCEPGVGVLESNEIVIG